VIFIEQGKFDHADTLESMIRRSESLTYLLGDDAEPDLAALQQALPGLELSYHRETRRLKCRYASEQHTPEEVNQQVLAQLLAAKCPLLEIRRGERLEDRYLDATRKHGSAP
jgi:hypothetical protein